MTSLNPDPFVVALVQVADTLPICLLALPAGALADIFDKRKFLIVVEVLTTVVSAIYAVIVGVGWATPGNLLLFTFLVGAAGALTVPAWQSVVPQLVPKDDLPAAIAAGLRYARFSPPLLATLLRAAGFFLFASAYWALLPLVAREQIAGGPALYGVLLGVIGASAVGGAFFLPWLKPKLGPDRLMAVGALGQAVAIVLYGLARVPATAILASVVAGAFWIGVVATLTVSAQVALPDWVRARGLALYAMVFFGCLAIGSAIWGEVAAFVGLPTAHFLAALGAALAIPLTWRWKLQTGAGVDLTPSMHWPAPLTAQDIEQDRGPVLVTVEYRISPQDREAFLLALEKTDGCNARSIFAPSMRVGGGIILLSGSSTVRDDNK